MAKEDAGLGFGCLAIIVIAVLWAIIKRIIKWSNENPETMICIGIAIGVVIVCWVVWAVTKKSRVKRREFDKRHGEWLKTIGAWLDDAEKFAKKDAVSVSELSERINKLDNSAKRIR